MPATYSDRINGLETSVAIKVPARAATTGNIALSGEQTIDGVAVVAGDRVLVLEQTNPVDNGVWVVGTGSWSRPEDMNGARDIVEGTQIYVVEGDTLASFQFSLDTVDPVIGVTGLVFSAVGRISSPYIARLGDVLHLRDFSPVDQSLDNVTALQAFAAAAAGGEHKEAILPAGEWRSSAPLTFDFAEGEQCVVSGASPDVTDLIFPDGTNGIIANIAHDTRNDGATFVLRDLAIVAGGDVVGDAITLNGTRTAGKTTRGFDSRGVYIKGETSSLGWLNGLIADDIAEMVLDNWKWLGKNGDKTSAPILISGGNSPTEHKINGFIANNFDTAIEITGTVEGTNIDQATLVSGIRGVDHNTTGEEPLLALTNSHINTVEYGALMRLTNQSIVSGNLFYQDSGVPGGFAGTDWAGIQLTDGDHNAFFGNVFHAWNALTNRYGINILAGSSNSISGNIYRGFSAPTPMTRGLYVNSAGNVIGKETFENVTTPRSIVAGNSVNDADSLVSEQYAGDLDALAGADAGVSVRLTTTGATNLPSGVNVVGNAVVTRVFDSATAYQELYAVNGDRGAYVRRKNSSAWVPWQKSIVGTSTGWAAATGTATRTTFATGSVTLPQLAERVKALIDDLTTRGVIGS